MNTDYTALALIVDRSGSMESMKSDVGGSVKHFVNEQRMMNGKASLTVVQFDDRFETIYDFEDITKVDEDKFGHGSNLIKNGYHKAIKNLLTFKPVFHENKIA
jgi:hypothetical protein